MRKARVSVKVTWDLDSVPGWNHEPEDVAKALENYIRSAIGDHYNPHVWVGTPEVIE